MFQSKTWSSWSNKLKNLFQSGENEVPESEVEKLLFESDLSADLVSILLRKTRDARKQGLEPALEALSRETVELWKKIPQTQMNLPTPASILLVGVNGSGKTTTAARLANHFRKHGRHVVLAAADTFRAGAVEQLQRWGQKLGIEVVSRPSGADPAAVVFDGWQKAKQENALLIADTAGRIHTHVPLMDELQKIFRSLAKGGGGAPHEVWLVLDGTNGQNAMLQSKEYIKNVPLTGLIMTKMDGTAKGGGAFSSAIESKLPIRFIGIGESEDDLIQFDIESFTKTFYGIQ